MKIFVDSYFDGEQVWGRGNSFAEAELFVAEWQDRLQSSLSS